MEKIKTDLVCPLCYSPVEIGVREKGAYYGSTENEKEIPTDARTVGSRKFGNGKTRYYYRMRGYIPACSNKACFLHGTVKMFRSKEEAESAWEERARPW